KKPEGEPPSEEEEFRGPRTPAVGVKAGMNRFVWDMRYPDAAGFPKIILWAGNLRGPVALPGTYQVRLTAAGQTLTQPFAIQKNPNLTNITDADLQEQFKLAMQIRDKLSQANEAVVKIRQLKDQVSERSKEGSGVVVAGQSLIRKLTDVEGEIYQYRNQSSQDPLNYPIKLNNKLAALEDVVESADARPTAQSYEVFKDLSARLDAQLARLDTLTKTEVDPFLRSAK
ncbi:MAG: hypothetical protein ACM3NQ_24000, partial [Bacteroidales bacterium]